LGGGGGEFGGGGGGLVLTGDAGGGLTSLGEGTFVRGGGGEDRMPLQG